MAEEGNVSVTSPGDTPVPPPASPALSPSAQPVKRSNLLVFTLLFAIAVFLSLLAYLVATVPDGWFPNASPKTWTAAELQVTRGRGRIVDGELVIDATDANGLAIISLVTNFRSADYRAVAWIGTGFPEQAEVRLLWRSNRAPERMNSAHVDVKYGHLLPLVMNDSAWLGRITGIALAVQGPLDQPLRIQGVVTKPMGALEILGDRVREWLAFEPWAGTSINTITGGADTQGLPLPLLLALSAGLAAGFAMLLRRWRPESLHAGTATIVAAFFLVAWFTLDARWTWNLSRQVKVTATQYAGKSWQEKHEIAEDGPLFEFVQKALQVMPAKPVRVVVAADLDYFRGRAAYHLYPHSVYFEPHGNGLPPGALRAGDWLLVYQQHGIQFNASEGKLRWDDGQSVAAELKLADPGAALFVIR